ncbi:carbamoyl phosphate synthase small subunit [Clostridiales bacterium PH28_bin88]|nr:carbamoyl phosphate synthase small subunit [Clostridiales bacterium PH28_bin88]
MTAILALEDGTIFRGKGFGYQGRQSGEVVFNTGMTGYQEVLTDPSYAGQIVTMTYPLIGNYGLNDQDSESAAPRVRGFVVREACDHPSNWRAREALSGYLARHRIIGLAGIDTRALTRRIRNHGTMRGFLSTLPEDVNRPEALAAEAAQLKLTGPELVRSVATTETYRLPGHGPRVVVLDFGIKQNILRMMAGMGCDLAVVPGYTPADQVLALDPQGVFLSNGPGDPKDVPEAIVSMRELIGRRPIFGICLGHQILALALGGDTYKLKFGHRGANHPVQDLATGRVYITSQNHGYAVDAESLPPDVTVTHRNLNDGTVEGLRHRDLPLFSVQYHPEAAPGPEDSRYLFDEFLQMIHEQRMC